MNLAVPHREHVTKWDRALGEDQKTWVDTLALTLGIWPYGVYDLGHSASSLRTSACSQFHGQSTLPRVAVRLELVSHVKVSCKWRRLLFPHPTQDECSLSPFCISPAPCTILLPIGRGRQEAAWGWEAGKGVPRHISAPHSLPAFLRFLLLTFVCIWLCNFQSGFIWFGFGSLTSLWGRFKSYFMFLYYKS